MEVLLRSDVEKLGKAGQIVTVAEGYARNYLLPHKLATPATSENLKRLEAEKRRAEREAARQRQALLDLAKQIESTSCTIVAQATESGHLFGSVSAAQIAEALQHEGFTMVTEQSIRLEHPVKETGVYAIEVSLAPDVVTTTRVWVVAD